LLANIARALNRMKGRCHYLHYKPASGEKPPRSISRLFDRYYILCSYSCKSDGGQRLFLLSKPPKLVPQQPPSANQFRPRLRAVCTRARGLFAHATTPGAPAILVTQANLAGYKNICASNRRTCARRSLTRPPSRRVGARLSDAGRSRSGDSRRHPLWRHPLSCCRGQTVHFGGRHMRLHVGVEQTPDHPLVLGLVF
jgi:hypothetical protein